MSFVAIFLVIIAALFALAFFTKRRFGVLGLALSAGAMLSTLWVGDLTPIIADAGIILIKPPLQSVVAGSLILLPALLLLSSGPAYKPGYQRLLGAAAFAVLAATLLLESLGSALMIEDIGKPVYELLVEYKVVIVTMCLALAIIDLLIARTPRRGKDH